MVRRLFLLLLVLAGPPGLVRAEPPVATADLAVDVVTLKKGVRLACSVIEQKPEGAVTAAVRRGWLRDAQPAFYEARLADERAERKAALEQLVDRIDDWRRERGDERRLDFFLKKEAERVRKSLEGLKKGPPDAPDEFLLLRFARSEVEKVHVQSAQRRQLAGVAWQENLPDVESRSAKSLSSELDKLKIDPAKVRVDLAERLVIGRQSETEWAARKAIVEYEYLSPLDFQGTGDLVVRTGEGAKAPGLAELLPGILQSQLAGPLADLLREPGSATAKSKAGSNEWLKSAAKSAAFEKVAGFRVTRVTPDASLRKVSVETQFVAQLPSGEWEPIWRHTESLDAAKADKAHVDRIANDPQVKQIFELTKTLGLEAGDDTLQTALQFGAATMQAQEAANSRFFEFRDRYAKRLDGPPIMTEEMAKVETRMTRQ